MPSLHLTLSAKRAIYLSTGAALYRSANGRCRAELTEQIGGVADQRPSWSPVIFIATITLS